MVKYFTHVTKAYENLYDDHKRAIYDDDTISDEDFFSIQIGPFKINLFLVFIVSSISSVSFLIYRRFYLGARDTSRNCPVNHEQRQEMAQI